MSVGESIRRARSARGLTQIDLAARAGISRQALGAIESGAYQPGVTIALNLTRTLGESVENLFGADGDDTCRHIAASWKPEPDAPPIPRTRVALARAPAPLRPLHPPAP